MNLDSGVPADVEIIRDVVYGTGGGRDLRMHVLRPRDVPDRPRPALVWIHGGAWRAGSKDSGIQRLIPYVRRGYVGATIEYRLSVEACFPSQIQDCKCAIRFLRTQHDRFGVDPERIGAWGESAGGHLAALLGTSGGVASFEGEGGWRGSPSGVQAVCDWYGPTDFLRMDRAGSEIWHDGPDSPESRLIGAPIQSNPDLAARANPISYVDGDEPPFLIVHGAKDSIVPLEQSQLLYQALSAAGSEATFKALLDAGHGGQPFEEPSVERLVAEFFAQYLKPAAPVS